MYKVAVNARMLLSSQMEGVSRFIHETCRRMVLAHPEIEFHFLFDRSYDRKFIYAENVVPNVLFPPARHPLLWYLWFEHSVCRFLEENKMDAFYSGDMYLSLKSRTPTLYVSHDLNYLHHPKGIKYSHLLFLKYFFPKYHQRADHIIAVSNFTKRDIINQFEISGDKISVAYNDVPSGFRPFSDREKLSIKKKLNISEDFFMYVGSLHPRKNIERLLEAFDLFRKKSQKEMKLLIYGRKAFKTGTIFKVYNAMHFKEDVIFVDDSEHQVSDVLPAAFALCYPSIFEGFGIPILEAFHSEVPVLTSNVSSMPEVAGDAAILINPFSVEDICSGMISLQDEKLRKNLIEASKAQIKKYSWDKSSHIIYEQLIKLMPN